MIYLVGNPPEFELLQDVPNKNPTPIFNAPCQTFKMDNNGRLGFVPKQRNYLRGMINTLQVSISTSVYDAA
jgi:hypothetical protein